MNTTRVRFFWVGVLLVGFSLLGVVGLIHVLNPWWLTALPPIPPQGAQVQTALFRDYASVADGTLRATHFAIDQPVAAVRAFYRTELPRQGWTYQGGIRPSCGDYVLQSSTVTDRYDRGGRTLIVHIVTPNPQERHQVRVVEYQGDLARPMQPTPVPSGGLPADLIGDWQTKSAAADQPFILCVYERGAVQVIGPGPQSLSGTYQWDDDHIQMTLDTAALVHAAVPGSRGDAGRCRDLPVVFQDGCQDRRSDPAAYPGPDGVISPAPTEGPPPTMGPYPPPPRPSTEYVHITGVFAVHIARDTLTLTTASGVTQTFRRVMP